MKGGIGSASFTVDGVTVGAIIACNALGDVFNPFTAQLLAGTRAKDGLQLRGTRDAARWRRAQAGTGRQQHHDWRSCHMRS